MLAKPHRLPASEIPRVMKYGKRIVGNGMTLIYRITDDGLRMTDLRFAFIVSTKVDKRATVRNRMRRLMSESVRHQWNSIQPGVDGIVIGSRSLIDRTQAEVEAIVLDLLQKAHLLRA